MGDSKQRRGTSCVSQRCRGVPVFHRDAEKRACTRVRRRYSRKRARKTQGAFVFAAARNFLAMLDFCQTDIGPYYSYSASRS